MATSILTNYRKEFPAIIEAGDAKKLANIALDADTPHHPRVLGSHRGRKTFTTR